MSSSLTEEVLPAQSQQAEVVSAVDKLVRLSHQPNCTSEEPLSLLLTFRYKALVIKAGLGMGKTTHLIRHLTEHPYKSVLVASPRRSFVVLYTSD